jgi:hypothetical protein
MIRQASTRSALIPTAYWRTSCLAVLAWCLLAANAQAQGALTNGAEHAGTIASPGQVDTWTFSANTGDDLTLLIGEVEPTSGFNPWIRLFAPDASALANSSGAVAAQINNLTATQTGTYTVLVSAVFNAPNGTGGYVLRLARVPGTFTVSPGDQGGALTNGANHTGEIVIGDIDVWMFSAAANDNITLSIGKVEPSVGFTLWIRLVGPTGTLITNSSGVSAAQINNFVAPQAGMYTVLVSAVFNAPAGTGGYRLTLARVPGTFMVSPGDQGGYLAIGASQPGEIDLGDVDSWTFLAAEGDALAITIGEVEPTLNFNPWIRLIGPTGTQVGNASGAVAAQLNLPAPATGLYTVLVSSVFNAPAGTGFYQLTVAGVTVVNPLSEIVLDFGPGNGLWVRYNQGPRPHRAPSWQLLHGLSPTVMTAARLDGNAADDLIATIPGYGVWIWLNNASWVQLHPFDATEIVAVDLNGNGLDELVLNFTGYGVWLRSDSGAWSQLHTQNATRIVAGRFDVGTARDLALDFPGHGVWLFLNNSTWVQLHGLNASQLQVANLDGNLQDDLILAFPGYGLWVRFNNSSWYQLHGLAPTAMAAGNLDDDAGHKQDLVVNFPGYGVWAYMNNATWVQLHGFAASVMAARDLDFDGRDDLILNFPGYGVWLLMNNSSFVPLHPLDAQGFVVGRLDPH